MEYVVTDIRFKCFNGKDNYTIEFSIGLQKWFIFKDEERTEALCIVPTKPREIINVNNALFHLNNYLYNKSA